MLRLEGHQPTSQMRETKCQSQDPAAIQGRDDGQDACPSLRHGHRVEPAGAHVEDAPAKAPTVTTPSTLLPQATHHLAHPQFPHLVLTGTPSSVGKASLGPATFSHTRKACCPIKTPALSRPLQAVNSLPVFTKSPRLPPRLRDRHSPGPSFTRSTGVQTL